jgi:hypothetical protein
MRIIGDESAKFNPQEETNMRRVAQLITSSIFLMFCLLISTVQADPIIILQPQSRTIFDETASGQYDSIDDYNIGTVSWQAVLDPLSPAESVRGGTSNFMAVLTAAFPASSGWTFVTAATNLSNGSLRVHTYDVKGTPSSVGAEFDLEYVPGAGDPIMNIHWIQVVTNNHSATNSPGHGSTVSILDNPFSLGPYYDDAGAADMRNFYDFPLRSDANMSHFWFADLYLVTGPAAGAPGQVTIHNGIRWGWKNDPVPEPATLLLLGTGLAGVAIKTRKKPKSRKTAQGGQ